MKRVLPYDAKVVPGNTPGAVAGNGLVIDRLGYRTVLIGLATAAITAGSINAKIQHGDASDGSDMVDFQPDGATITTDTLTASNTNTSKEIKLTGAKRYIRFVTATTGTVAAFSSYATLGDVQYGQGFNY